MIEAVPRFPTNTSPPPKHYVQRLQYLVPVRYAYSPNALCSDADSWGAYPGLANGWAEDSGLSTSRAVTITLLLQWNRNSCMAFQHGGPVLKQKQIERRND